MPSPFPGMDPYIESSGLSGDFHLSLLSAIRAVLNQHLPRDYVALIQEYYIGEYYAMGCRHWEYPKADFWSIGLRDLLPEVPIPLEEGVLDVPLPLKACVEDVYDSGRYATSLNYDNPLHPSVSSEDAVWINNVLTNRNSRGK